MNIAGEIAFASQTAAFENATVIIRVEDVRYADAPAVVVAEQRLPNVTRSAGSGEAIAFHLEFPAQPPLTHYSLRVHVDVNGDGEVSPGDYITTQSYPLNDLQAFVHLIVHPVTR